jgi:tetratricopeptide (TPR) repeat protein
LINIGICYKNLGKFEEAIATYEKVNELSPTEEGGYYNYAMSLLALIEKNSVKRVTNVDIERAQKVTELFDKAENLNHWNYMIKLARIKLSVLIDRRESNIAASILSLKNLLSTVGFDGLEKEISEIIALCLGFKSMS